MAEKETQDAFSGMDENVRAALSYVLGWITGLVFLLVEKDSEFVKFHAMQSLITFLGLTIVYMVIGSLMASMFYLAGGLWGILSLVNTLLMLIGFILWLVLMIKAYQGEKYKLPVIGDIADNQV